MSKVLIVDDSDPSITYNGAWQALGTVSDTSHEFNGTTHRGDSTGQTISYSFDGTGISVYGTLDTPATKGTPGVSFKVDSIDAIQINSTGTLTYNLRGIQSHQVLYQSPNLVQGRHTLTISMTASAGSTGPYFFFDFFAVKTGKDSVSGYVLLDDRDSSIQYVPQWVNNGIPPEYQGTTSQTGATGSFATVPFNGTEIYVYGTTDSGASGGACQIGFDVDGVTGPDYNCESTPALLHNVLFSNKDLTDGNHTLKVNVKNSHTWFLDYIIYKTSNSSVAANADNGNGDGGNGDGGNGGDNNNGGGGSKSNTGAIAGGVVGGLLGLAALAFLALWLLRRQKKSHEKMEQEAHPVMTAPGAASTNGHSFNGYGSAPMSVASSGTPGSTPFMAQNVPLGQSQPYGYAQGFGYGTGQPQGMPNMPQPGVQYSLIPPEKGSNSSARQAALHAATPSLSHTGDTRSSMVESSVGATSIYSGIQQTAVRQTMPPVSEVPQSASTMAMPVGGNPNWVNYNTPHSNSFTSPTPTSEGGGITSSGHTGTGAASGWPNEKRPGELNVFSGSVQPQPAQPRVEVDSGRRFRPTTSTVPPAVAPPVYTED